MAYGAFHTLKINRFKILADLSNFPVYVDITDPTLKDVAHGGSVTSSSGYDIGFSSDSAGTSLYKWEVEAYDPVAGRIRAHVKVPTVSSSSHTVFYLPYGDSGITTDQSDPVNVWTNSFLAVYHMKDGSTLSVLDSRNVNNGTNHGATAGAGQIDGCGSFASGSSQYIDLGTGINPAALTYSAWVNATTFPGTYNAVLNRSNVGYTIYTMFNVRNTGKLTCYASGTGTTNYDNSGIYTLTTGIWYHIAMTYDSTSGLKGYVNGALDGSAASVGALNTTALNTYIGVEINTANRLWNGLIDEARISSVARPIEWIFAEYSSQNTPSTFIYVNTDPPAARDLIGQTAGYYSVADLDDTTPQPDQANSGAGTENPANLRPFIWPVLGIAPGIVHDIGGTQKIFLKRFEADIDPGLTFSGLLNTFKFILAASMAIAANLFLSAKLTKKAPALMVAVAAFQGDIYKRSAKSIAASITSIGKTFLRLRVPLPLIFSAHISFVENLAREFIGLPRKLLTSTLILRGTLSRNVGRVIARFLIVLNKVYQEIIAIGQQISRSPNVVLSEQFVSETPTVLDLHELQNIGPIDILFIKNHGPSTVEIDSSDTFDQFPQSIDAGLGVFLSPDTEKVLYARSVDLSIGGATIQIIASR